jgi:DNA gyrase/topoisomerase IV subunit B
MTQEINFRELDDRQHALERPSMYIGSTTLEEHSAIVAFRYQTKSYVPGLIKLIGEILDNSIDEHIRTDGKFANMISVSIDKGIDGTSITIKDNGRGIPVQEHGDSWIPVKAWTRLRAGANFDKKRTTIGANGVGSALVNIFSTSFVGKTCDGKNTMTVTCSDNMQNIDFTKSKATTPQGTTVTFYPDLSRFGLTDIDKEHQDIVRDRLANLAVVYPSIKFIFNGETLKFKNLKELASNFHESFVVDKTDKVSLVISPAGTDEEFRCLSYVNGLCIKNGGTHVDYAIGAIIYHLRTAIKKKHKFDVLPNHIKQHLLFASWITGAEDLKFDSQTKERITNSQAEVSALFLGIDFEKISKKIMDTPDIIEPIVSALVRKQELAEQAELRKKNKDAEKANLDHITKFTDATSKNRKECMLMICEGDSASNAILSARTALVGCYPLRGKPLNAFAAKKTEILQNTELSELMAILGLKIGEKVNSLDDLRFGKIVMVTDADLDGYSISGLLFAMIRKFWPELFSLGAIHFFETPIMKTIQGTKEQYFDTMAEFEKWQTKQTKPFKTRYLKGLGSSTAADFRLYFSEIEKRLSKISIDSDVDFDVIDMLYSKDKGSSDLRKKWLDIE